MRGCPPGCSPTGTRRSRRETSILLTCHWTGWQPGSGPSRPGYMAVRRGGPVRQALELDLINELRLTIIPTLLGAGIPLFRGLRGPKLLELVSHRAENGMVECIYRRRGAAQ